MDRENDGINENEQSVEFNNGLTILEKPNEEHEWETLFLDEKDEQWEQEKIRRRKGKSLIVKFVSSLLVLTMIITGMQIWFDLFNLPAIRFLETSKRLSENPQVIDYKKSIVKIEWDGVKGTGFNVNKDGLIVTNEHVVENTNTVNVYFYNGKSYIGKVLSRNPDLDLAVVDIEANNLTALPLSYEQNWKKWTGERIIFIGNHLAYTLIANEGTVKGEILLQNWKVPVMMIEAPVYKGNSGSPIINKNGEVIGIIFATISSSEINKEVAVAIPSFYLQEILQSEKILNKAN